MANPFPQFIPDDQKRPKATTANPFPEHLPQAAPANPGMVERGMEFVSGLGDVIDQGWSLGGADELGAAIGAGARRLTNALTRTSPDEGTETFSELYDERLKRRQGDLREFREAHPVASFVGEVAGAAPTAALGGAVAGMSRLPALAKALIGGGGAGGAYGFLSGEGDVGDRTDDAVMGAALGAGLGGAGVGVSKAIANRTAKRAGDRTIEEAASQDELRQAAQANYGVADAAQGAVPMPVYSTFVTKLNSKLKKEGADKLLHPKATRVMDLMAAGADAPATLQDLQILRRQFGAAAKSAEPDERRLGQIALDELDDFVENSAGQLGGALKEGRALWARMRKSELIEETIEKATTRASGVESGLRNEFSKLYRNKKLMRGFNEEEKNAIKSVFEGTAGQNALRILGGLSLGEGQRRNVLSALVGGGVGMAAMGPGGGMAGLAGPAIVGGVAQKLAEAGTKRRAQLARAITAGPRPAPSGPIGMAAPPGPQRGVPMLPGPTQPRLPGRPALDVFLEQGQRRRLR